MDGHRFLNGCEKGTEGHRRSLTVAAQKESRFLRTRGAEGLAAEGFWRGYPRFNSARAAW